MIRIQSRVVRYGQIWFDEAIPAAPGVDILQFRQRPVPIEGHVCTPFVSIVTDLRRTEAEMFSAFTPNTRNEIRRANARDGLEYKVFGEPGAELDTFCDFYDEFARGKAILAADRRELRAACGANRLALTRASFDGVPLVWHSYITGGSTVRLHHSASLFRGEKRSQIARANRWLHWRDMLIFKQFGYERLCFGGLFEDETEPEHGNINRFKRSFGGQEERTFECVVPVTLKGRVYKALLGARKALAKSSARRRARYRRRSEA